MAQKSIEDVAESKSPLLQERHVYKPFLYPWCYEAWLTQQRIHWIPEEVPLAEDVRKKDRKLGYTIGFFLFWACTFASSLFTSWLLAPRRDAGHAPRRRHG